MGSSNSKIVASPALMASFMKFHLFLYTNFISEMAPHAFRGMDSLEELYLSENSISSLDPAAFEGLRALRTLYLDNNMLSELSPEPFKNITALESLRFNRNRLSTVKMGTFDDLVNLKDLWLHGNMINIIKDQSFKSLKKLEYLFLSYNRLTHVTSGMFTGLESLKTVNFESNRIRSIELLDGFKSATKNTEINLRKNDLTSLSCNPFLNVLKPMFLDISGNRVNCDGLCWLKQEVDTGSIKWVVQQSAVNGIAAGHVFKPACADGTNWDDISWDCNPEDVADQTCSASFHSGFGHIITVGIVIVVTTFIQNVTI